MTGRIEAALKDAAEMQVALLKEMRGPELAALEIGTVDGFQGTLTPILDLCQ